MSPSFVIAVIAWFAVVVALVITAARITDRKPRLAFGLLMSGLIFMLWGLLFVMAT